MIYINQATWRQRIMFLLFYFLAISRFWKRQMIVSFNSIFQFVLKTQNCEEFEY